MKLNDVVVRTLPVPPKGAKIYHDETLAGFGIRVTATGVRSFVLTHGAQRERITVGRYPIIGLADARIAAKRFLAERMLNKHRPARMVFADALALFVAEKEQKNRARTITENKRLLTKYFPALHRKNLEDLQTNDITRQLDKLHGTPGTALHAFWAMRTLLRWCVKRRYLQHNPIDGLDAPAAVTFRERVLSDQELALVWQVAETVGHPFGAIVKLLILTGQRRTEIGSLRVDYINGGSICLPSEITKNRRTHTFPITASATAIVADHPGNHAYLFQSDTPDDAPFNGWSKAKTKLDHLIAVARGSADEPKPLPHWTLHDLRRTYATGLQRLGVKIEVIEALLNHISGTRAGIVGVYQRYHYQEEMLAAIALWENHLKTILASE